MDRIAALRADFFRPMNVVNLPMPVLPGGPPGGPLPPLWGLPLPKDLPILPGLAPLPPAMTSADQQRLAKLLRQAPAPPSAAPRPNMAAPRAAADLLRQTPPPATETPAAPPADTPPEGTLVARADQPGATPNPQPTPTSAEPAMGTPPAGTAAPADSGPETPQPGVPDANAAPTPQPGVPDANAAPTPQPGVPSESTAPTQTTEGAPSDAAQPQTAAPAAEPGQGNAPPPQGTQVAAAEGTGTPGAAAAAGRSGLSDRADRSDASDNTDRPDVPATAKPVAGAPAEGAAPAQAAAPAPPPGEKPGQADTAPRENAQKPGAPAETPGPPQPDAAPPKPVVTVSIQAGGTYANLAGTFRVPLGVTFPGYAGSPSLSALAREISARTRVKVTAAAALPLDGPLAEAPLLYIKGREKVAFTDEQRAALRAYVEAGGTLFADGVDGEFGESLRAEFARTFGKTPAALAPSHPLFSAYFRLGTASGLKTFALQAILVEDRPAVILSPAFLGRRWQDKDDPDHEVAVAQGTNILVYALAGRKQQ